MKESSERLGDNALAAAVLLLVFLGLVMIYSSSAVWAARHLGRPLYFLERQILWAALGLPAMILFSRVNYNRYREKIGLILALTLAALFLALLGPKAGGAARWIRLGPVHVQPSEFAKLSCILFLAYYLDKKRSRLSSPSWSLLRPALVLSPIIFLIAKEPDLGTPILIGAVSLGLLFAAGTPLKHLLGAAASLLPLVAYELIRYPYRRARLADFLSRLHGARNAGYQLSQSLLAVGSGGIFGKGLGASDIKLMYLPTPHTDFIFSVLCEELGLLGALALLSLFIFFMIRGIRIARAAPNLFGSLLAAGITWMICLQAFVNMAMSVGLLPTKGVPIPFVSFGGSSLVAGLIGVGILLNISRQARLSR